MEVITLKVRNLNSREYKLLKREFDYLKDENVIDHHVYERIMAQYKESEAAPFIFWILIVGSLLMGLGILTFVASNWYLFTKPIKFAIILIFYAAFALGSYIIKDRYKRTSKSLLYIAFITYGAGLILISEMFNSNNEMWYVFLLWSLGILPMGIAAKDKIILVFSEASLIVYVLGGKIFYTKLAAGILGIMIFYSIGKRLKDFKLTYYGVVVLFLSAVSAVLNEFNASFGVIALIYFILGLTMQKASKSVIKNTSLLLPVGYGGCFVYGYFGTALSFPNVINDIIKLSITNLKIISVIFSIGFLVFLLWETKKKNIIGLLFVFVIIMRYYFDTLYNFIPKSLFFLAGGVMLILFGFFLEKFRKEGINSLHKGKDGV